MDRYDKLPIFEHMIIGKNALTNYKLVGITEDEYNLATDHFMKHAKAEEDNDYLTIRKLEVQDVKISTLEVPVLKIYLAAHTIDDFDEQQITKFNTKLSNIFGDKFQYMIPADYDHKTNTCKAKQLDIGIVAALSFKFEAFDQLKYLVGRIGNPKYFIIFKD